MALAGCARLADATRDLVEAAAGARSPVPRPLA
jgi:hypothetical protein